MATTDDLVFARCQAGAYAGEIRRYPSTVADRMWKRGHVSKGHYTDPDNRTGWKDDEKDPISAARQREEIAALAGEGRTLETEQAAVAVASEERANVDHPRRGPGRPRNK